MLTLEQELEIFEQLKKIDTPTITNVVATYPAQQETCLGLYHPWRGKWYTDQTLKCMYPELGPRVGFAVTCTFGLPDASFGRLGYGDLFRAIADSPKPAVVVCHQNMPAEYKDICGLFGGNFMTAFRSCGAVGVLTDGPSRDVDEVRSMGMQYMLTGVCAGHGPFALEQVGAPVEVCGMMVATGEIIHMDENGAVKFPRAFLPEILPRVEKILQSEQKRQALIRQTNDPQKIADIMKGLYD